MAVSLKVADGKHWAPLRWKGQDQPRWREALKVYKEEGGPDGTDMKTGKAEALS